MSEENQDNLILYETIFKRKSIRKYDLTPLDDELLKEISNYITRLTPMYAQTETETRIVGREQVKTGLQGPAPHYVAIFSEKTNENLLSIGFMFQLLSLYLTNRGIASCWQGIPKPTDELKKSSKYEFVIFLAFGNSHDSLYRKEISEFSRDPIEKITDSSDLKTLLEPTRLAPSAINNQPWFFIGDESLIHVYCKEQNMIKRFFIKKYNMLDIGIALSYLWLTLKKNGKETVFFADTLARKKNIAGYYYVNSLKIE